MSSVLFRCEKTPIGDSRSSQLVYMKVCECLHICVCVQPCLQGEVEAKALAAGLARISGPNLHGREGKN